MDLQEQISFFERNRDWQGLVEELETFTGAWLADLRLARENDFDLVLTDYKMTGMDGLTLLGVSSPDTM